MTCYFVILRIYSIQGEQNNCLVITVVCTKPCGLIVLNTYYEQQGHRAELYATRVAKCLAALEGREKVYVDDLKKAVSFL